MPQYSKTTWVDGTAPAISAANLNKLEQGVFDSIRQDGSTTMSAQLVTIAGSAATPAIAPTGDSNTGIFFPAADTIAFGEGGTEAMRITSAGNVGIGTTNALEKLHVDGGGIIVTGDVSSVNANALLMGYNSGTGEARIATGGVSGASSFLTFTTSNAGAEAERMRITSTGNVGIGTTNPQAILHLYGASSPNLLIQDTTNNVQVSTTALDSFGQIGTGTNHDFRMIANNSECMRITSTGNVGIGTTAPAVSGLEISRATGTATPTPAELRISTTNSASDWSTTNPWGRLSFYSADASNGGAKIHASIDTIATATTGGTSRLDFNITDGQATPSLIPAMTILSTASANPTVGIGTTAPSTEFHVKGAGEILRLETKTARGSGENYIAFYDPTGAKGFMGFTQTGSDTLVIRNSLSAAMQFATNNTTRMTITSGGDVGINQTSPAVKLHITGTSEMLRLETTSARGSGNNRIHFHDPDGEKGFFGYANGADWLYLANSLNARLVLRTNALDRLIIDDAGTTRPAANNTYELGNSAFRWSTIYAQNALNTSDERLKTDIAESSLGLEFVTSLNPVQFRYIEGGNTVERVQTGTEIVEITPAIPAQPEVLDEEGNVIQEATEEVPAVTEEQPIYEEVVTPREGVRTHFGLLAQEVKAALPDGLDFAGWALADKNDAESTQFLGYAELIAPMIKAIKELKVEVDALKAQIAK